MKSLRFLVPIAALVLAVGFVGSLRAGSHDQEDTDKLEIPEAVERLLGKAADKDGQAHCRIRSSDVSYLGSLNRVSCLLSKLGIQGATGASGVTSTIHVGLAAITFHVQVDAGPFTVSSVKYDWKAQVWTCVVPADCTDAANFQPFIFWLFNSSDDGSVNNGLLAQQLGLLMGNTATGGLQVQYDIGTATVPTHITTLVVDTRPSLGEHRSTGALATRVDVGRTGTLVDLTQLLHTATRDSRLSVAVDNATGAGGFYFESSQRGNLQASASGDTPAPEACFVRSMTGDEDDFDYTVAVDATTGLPVTTGCSAAAFPAYAESQLAGETVTTATTLPGQSSVMGGMAAHPASL